MLPPQPEGLPEPQARVEEQEREQVGARILRLNPDAVIAYRALAASYAQLGRIDEARAALAEVLRIDPDRTLEKVKRTITDLGFDPDVIEHQIDGLRKAGLPE